MLHCNGIRDDDHDDAAHVKVRNAFLSSADRMDK